MFADRLDGNSVSEIVEEPNSFQKFLDGNSTEKHDDHAQVHFSIIKTDKKKKKRDRKKKKASARLSYCPISNIGSTEEGASSSQRVIQDSLVGDIHSNQEAPGPSYTGKMVEDMVVGDGTSVLIDGKILQEKASVECPDGGPGAGKRKKKSKPRRKKRKGSTCTVGSLGSINGGAPSSVPVAQDSSVRDISSHRSDKAPVPSYSGEMMELVVAGDGTSVPVAGEISQEKASGECPAGEPVSGKQKKKYKMGNAEENNTGRGRAYRRKKRKLSACPINSLGSVEEGAASVREISSNHPDEAPAPGDSGKTTEEVVAGDGTSFLVAGEISQEIASGECPECEPVFGGQKKKSKEEKSEENNIGHGSYGRKKGKLSSCSMSSLVAVEEGASPSVLADSSVRDIYANHLDEAPAPSDSGKMMDMAAGHGSEEKASGECPDGKPESAKPRTNCKKENFEEINTGHGRCYGRKKGNLSCFPISSLGSFQECASQSALDVRDSPVRERSTNQLGNAPAPSDSGKMEEVVVGYCSEEKASGECPDGEPESVKQKDKSKVENLEEINTGFCVVKDASLVGLPGKNVEQGNKDKLDVIQNAVLHVYSAEENVHYSTTFSKDKASDSASGSDHSVDNLESDNLGVQPMLTDAIPLPSQLDVISDGISLVVIGKEEPHQRLQSSQAGAPPGNLRKKLLVLDVNGLLADIVPFVPGRFQPDKVISQKAVFKRPFCDDFLQFCFERFHVGVWSSRNKRNVNSVLDFLMGKSKCNLLFCWDQSHCTDTGYNTVENREKPLLLKELKKLWEKHEPVLPWASGEYNESNTLLLDDSPYKALRNPPHTAIFPHSYTYRDQRDNSLGPGGDLRVYLEGLASADNVQTYVELNPFGQRPITKTNLSWRFYCKIIGTTSPQLEEDANDSSACQPSSR